MKMRYFFIAVLWLFSGDPARAQDTDLLQEYQIKAVYLFNFTHFVTWPEQAFANKDEAITLCVLGKNPFGDWLDKILRDETVRKRPLQARYLNTTANLTQCHVLFIAQSVPQVAEVLHQVAGAPVLTVAETPGFLSQGGMVRLHWKGKNVRFAIHQDQAESAGLQLSYKLLNLAQPPEGTP